MTFNDLDKIDVNILNKKVLEFKKAYLYWGNFFNRILEQRENSSNPNIHSLVHCWKIIILSGCAENMGQGNSDKKKFDNFLSNLTVNEKLYFVLLSEIEDSGLEGGKLFGKYNETADGKYLEEWGKFMKEKEIQKEAVTGRLLKEFSEQNYTELNLEFKKRCDLLYGIRSKIVHTGNPVAGSAIFSTGEIFYHAEKDEKLLFSKLNLEDIFIRAAFRLANIEPASVIPQLRKHLEEEHITKTYSTITMHLAYDILKA